MNAVLELEAAYEKFKNDPEFKAELARLYREYANRPSLLYYAEKMTKTWVAAKLFEARGFEPHRRPQNQQRSGTDSAGAEDGQKACYR